MPTFHLNDLNQILGFHGPETSTLNDAIFEEKQVTLSMLRLDQIHSDISGNKIFKLYYFLLEALASSHKTIVTFGGAYSNHLAATSFACKALQLKCIGVVRGEEPAIKSPTLLFCAGQGMHLEYMSRTDYKKIEEGGFPASLAAKFGSHTLIPEGGFSKKGVLGVGLISEYFTDIYSHICLAAGTATTFAGIMNTAPAHSKTIGFSILKNCNDIKERFSKLSVTCNQYYYNQDYHFGGYAKKTHELIDFMNQFYRQHHIPLDFVYTAKMMFGVTDLIKKNYFPEGSKILCLHTGGLQGNQSLPNGTLLY